MQSIFKKKKSYQETGTQRAIRNKLEALEFDTELLELIEEENYKKERKTSKI